MRRALLAAVSAALLLLAELPTRKSLPGIARVRIGLRTEAGRPTGARVRVTNAAGEYFAPLGHLEMPDRTRRTAGDIILADPSYYLIGDHVSGLRISFSPHYRFANDQMTWRVTKRVDGQPMLENAYTGEDGTATYSPFVVLAAV